MNHRKQYCCEYEDEIHKARIYIDIFMDLILCISCDRDCKYNADERLSQRQVINTNMLALPKMQFPF